MASVGIMHIGLLSVTEDEHRANTSQPFTDEIGGRAVAARNVNHQPYHNRSRDSGLRRIAFFEESYADSQWDWLFKMRAEAF